MSASEHSSWKAGSGSIENRARSSSMGAMKGEDWAVGREGLVRMGRWNTVVAVLGNAVMPDLRPRGGKDEETSSTSVYSA